MTEPVEFSDVETESAEPVNKPARRGRPRTLETIARDDAVLKELERGPATKEQLVDVLRDQPTLIYLSLWRLRKAGRIERVTDGSARHTWQVVESSA